MDSDKNEIFFLHVFELENLDEDKMIGCNSILGQFFSTGLYSRAFLSLSERD